jgi:hypothetical protein
MKKKILETSMLLYQYLYYAIRDQDEQLWLPVSFTQFRAFGAFFAFETMMLLTVCVIVHRTIFGHTFVNANLPDPATPSFIIGGLAYVLVTTYINNKILGSDRRIEHYKKMFDSWDKWKRWRWSFYTYSILASIVAVLLLTIEADQNGPNPKNWQWEETSEQFYFWIPFLIVIIILSNFVKRNPNPNTFPRLIGSKSYFSTILLILGTILIIAPIFILLLNGFSLNELELILQMLMGNGDRISPFECVLVIVSVFSGIGFLIWGGIRFLIFKMNHGTRDFNEEK